MLTRTWIAAFAVLLAMMVAGYPSADRAAPKPRPKQGQAWLDTSVEPAILKVYDGRRWQPCERTSLRMVFVCGSTLVDSESGRFVRLPPEFLIEGDGRPR